MSPPLSITRHRTPLRGPFLALGLIALGGTGRLPAQNAGGFDLPRPPEIAPSALVPPRPAATGFAAPAQATTDTPFHRGPFAWHPRVSFAYEDGNGLPAGPGNAVSGAIARYGAGVGLDLGSHWAADYAGTSVQYSHPALHDSFDQMAALTGGLISGGWTLQVSQSWAKTAVPLAETAGQTTVRRYETGFKAALSPGSGWRLEGSVQQDVRFTALSPATREWPTAVWLVRRLGPGLEIGAGTTAGLVDIDPGPRQRYRRPQLRLEWRPRPTLLLRFVGGRERRTASAGPVLDQSVYRAAAEYQPFPTTRWSARREQDATLTLLTAQVSANIRDSIEWQQRLLGHVYLTATYARQKIRHLGTAPPGPAGESTRADDGRTTSVRLSLPLRARATVAIFHQHNRNASTLEDYGFSGSRFGVEVGYRY